MVSRDGIRRSSLVLVFGSDRTGVTAGEVGAARHNDRDRISLRIDPDAYAATPRGDGQRKG